MSSILVILFSFSEMPDHLQRYMTGVFSSSDNRCFDLVYIKTAESVKGAL